MRQPWIGPVSGFVAACLVAAVITNLLAFRPNGARAAEPFLGTTNVPEVTVALDLANPLLHPWQLAYDKVRDGLWFWTSTQERGLTFENRVYFFDLATRQVRSWPIYSGDWSSQLLAGLAVAPDGAVWIGWNMYLVVFHPENGQEERYDLPTQPHYPLSATVVGDRPADLGIADVAVAPDGVVWIARYGALSLTSFDPASQTFTEHPLPLTAGDPAKLAIGAEGHILFTTNLSADHPDYLYEKVGEYDPHTGKVLIIPQPAQALTLTPTGDLYSTIGGDGFGLARLSATARAAAWAQGEVAATERQVVPFNTDGTAVSADGQGRIWMAVSGKPEIALLDPASGQVKRFQYAAPSVAAHPAHFPGQKVASPPAPNAVWITHIVAMATDRRGHLFYIRAGADRIEEVAA